MAEIRVEPRRRSLAWLWILLVLIIVGGLVYYLLSMTTESPAKIRSNGSVP